MLQNGVLKNGNFKPRPKLAESSSKQAKLAPSQLVGDGGAVDGRRSGRLQLAVEGIDDHSERSEPAGRAGRADVTDVVPPPTVALQSRVGVPVRGAISPLFYPRRGAG